MVRHIMFDGKHMRALLSGRKKITIRALSSSIPRPGSLLYVHCGGKVLGEVRVVSVHYKPFKELTDKEAREEGLSSREVN